VTGAAQHLDHRVGELGIDQLRVGNALTAVGFGRREDQADHPEHALPPAHTPFRLLRELADDLLSASRRVLKSVTS
jgi:hypothetical protein